MFYSISAVFPKREQDMLWRHCKQECMASCSSSYCSIRKPLSNVAVGSLLDATISVLLTKTYILRKVEDFFKQQLDD